MSLFISIFSIPDTGRKQLRNPDADYSTMVENLRFSTPIVENLRFGTPIDWLVHFEKARFFPTFAWVCIILTQDSSCSLHIRTRFNFQIKMLDNFSPHGMVPPQKNFFVEKPSFVSTTFFREKNFTVQKSTENRPIFYI